MIWISSAANADVVIQNIFIVGNCCLETKLLACQDNQQSAKPLDLPLAHSMTGVTATFDLPPA